MINLYPNINNNDSAKNISFNGLFSRKKEPVVFMLKYGQGSVLSGEARTPIPEESIINFRDSYKIDLTKSPLKERIKKLKKDDSIVIGRADINPDDITISRKQFELRKIDKVLYVCNLSQFGTDFTLLNPNQTMAPKNFPKPVNTRQFNPFVNLNPQYLKSVYDKPQINFRELFDRKYNEMRIAKYSYDSTFTNGSLSYIQQAIMTPPENGHIHQENCWNYRGFQYGYPDNITNRVSMNVKADPRLMNELDEFMMTGRYIDLKGRQCRVPKQLMVPGYYKTYTDAKRWTDRHDPITMYFSGEPTNEMLNALSDISQKYARPSCNGISLVNALPGKPWISAQKEPKEEFLKPVLKKAEGLNPNLLSSILSACYRHWDYQNGYRDFFVSAGEFDAIKFVVEEYDAFLRLTSADRTA